MGRGHSFGDLMKSHLPAVVGRCNVCGQPFATCVHTTPAPLPDPDDIDDPDMFGPQADAPTDVDPNDVDPEKNELEGAF
jgi:hypothetical protein